MDVYRQGDAAADSVTTGVVVDPGAAVAVSLFEVLVEVSTWKSRLGGERRYIGCLSIHVGSSNGDTAL